MESPLALKKPSATLVSRISDRTSFLYLERCRLEQDENGTAALIEVAGKPATSYLPSATITTVMLGPGTSITQAAVRALGESGCGVVFVGGGVVRSYGAFLPVFGSTTLLARQAQVVSDETMREQAARTMFKLRFPDEVSTAVRESSIERLRGVEGARMRAVYATHAKRNRIRSWKRVNGHVASPVSSDTACR